MVLCLFSHPCKKLHACSVFRNKVTDVEGSSVQAAEIEMSQSEQQEMSSSAKN
jgi:hypothetical protein